MPMFDNAMSAICRGCDKEIQLGLNPRIVSLPGVWQIVATWLEWLECLLTLCDFKGRITG